MSTSREACPFCGKTFKRLNSHLPKCKMAHVSKTAAPKVLTHPVQQDHTLGKMSKKKSSPSTTSQKIKNTSDLLYSTPSSNKFKVKKASLPLSPSTLTTTKKTKTPLSPSPLTTSIETMKKQKLLDETLIVSKDCLPKDPDGILMKHIPTPTVKHNADSTTDIASVTATVKKLKASSTKAKLKASPATTTLPVTPKAKVASKKVSLRKQIELFAQRARAAASLPQEPVTEEQGEEVRLSIQDHPASMDDLTCNHLYNKTSLLDHKPTITSNLNKERLCSKTSKHGTQSVDHSSCMVDLIQTKTSDHLYKNNGLLLVGLGQTAASALSHTSVTVGMLAPKTNSAQSLTMKPQKLSQTETVKVLKSIVEPSYPPLSAPSSTSAPLLISPGVHDQSRDTGPQCSNFPHHLPPIPSLSLSPPASPLLCSAPSPILSPWIPTRDVIGMEVMLEMTMPYQMIGLKLTFSPCSCAWHVLVGLMLNASTRFTPFLTPSPPNPLPSRPPTFSGPPLPFLSPSLPVCTERAKLATANASRTSERAQLNGRKYGTEQRIIGALSLGEVRLKELPGWIATRAFHNPRQRAQALPRSWQWYYRTYVDVKGGVGRIAMLLAGYCFLNYTWSCPQFTRDRWRKYH